MEVQNSSISVGEIRGDNNTVSFISTANESRTEEKEDESLSEVFPHRDERDRPFPGERLGNRRKKLDDVFVETEFFRHLQRTLKDQGTVALTGPPGDGKTTMAVMMSKSLEKDGYSTMYNKSVDTVNVEDIAKTERSVFLVIDNAFGRCRFNHRQSELTRDILSRVRKMQEQTNQFGEVSVNNQAGAYGQNTKKPLLLLILFRNNVYEHAKANVRKLGEFAVRLDTENSLKLNEKIDIWSKYDRKANATISEDKLDIVIRKTLPLGFPTMCRLYAALASPEDDPELFFDSDVKALINAVSEMISKNPMNKLALALMVLEESVNLLHLEDQDRQIPYHLDESLNTVAKELNDGNRVSRSELNKSLKKMCGILLTLEDGFVGFNADNIQDVVVNALAKDHKAFVARHCSLDFITDTARRTKNESRSPTNQSQSNKIIPQIHRDLIEERLLQELKKGNLSGVFEKSSSEYHFCLNRVLGHVVNCKQLDDIAHTRDKSRFSFLFWVAMTSFSNFHIFKQVSFTDDELWEALCACCATDKPSQVRVFCNQLRVSPRWTKALCEHAGLVEERMNFSLNTSPVLQKHKSIPGTLAAACGHENVLRTLLDLGMPVDVQNTFGETPLMHACGGDYKNIVELLLRKRADFTISDRKGCNALHWAVWFNSKEAAKTLIQNANAEAAIDVLDNPNTSQVTPLMLACWKAPEIARLLIESGLKTTLTDEQGRTCFHYACCSDDLGLVQEMVGLYGMDVNAVDRSGFSPLHQACARPGNQKAVRALLDAGADPNMRATIADTDSRSQKVDPLTPPNGVGPLHVACTNEVEIAKLLLEKGAEKDALDGDKQTPIMYACDNGKTEIVKFLLREGANVRLRDLDDNTILHHVSQAGTASVVETILDTQPEIMNAKNRNNLTPLCVACAFGNVDVVHCLIARNAEIEKSDENGGNILHVSSSKGKLTVVKFLVEETEIDIDSIDKRQWTPLMLACFFGRERVIFYLVREDADIHCADEDGYTVMHLVAANGNSAALMYVAGQKRMEVDVKSVTRNQTPENSDSEIDYVQSMQHVVEAGAKPSSLDLYGNSPLHHAAAGGNQNIIDYLLDEVHILIDEKNSEENTPFLMACISGQVNALKHFVNKGADPQAKDRFGNTALHHGSGEGHLPVLEYLVKTLKLNVNEKNSSGETPLAVAVRRERTNVYDFLCRYGAVTSLSNNNEDSSLHTAAKAGNIPAARYLLDYGNLHVDVTNEKNETPLHCASAFGQTEMARYLIERGASTLAKCNDCEHLPVHLAVIKQHLATVKVLLEKDPRTIDTFCASGRTPLCHGCEGSFDIETSELAQFLIQFDRSSTHRENGDTSLHVAARGGYMTTVSVLVERVQMKVDVLNDNKETPLDCARSAGQSQVVDYFEKRAS